LLIVLLLLVQIDPLPFLPLDIRLCFHAIVVTIPPYLPSSLPLPLSNMKTFSPDLIPLYWIVFRRAESTLDSLAIQMTPPLNAWIL
jgi:hypothetical protein